MAQGLALSNRDSQPCSGCATLSDAAVTVAAVALSSHRQILRRGGRAPRRVLRHRRRRGARHRRRKRRRQVDAAEDPRGRICGPTAASCAWASAPVTLASPRDALARGIGLVHQEMLLVPEPDRGREHLRRPRADRPLRLAPRRAMRDRRARVAGAPALARVARHRRGDRCRSRTASSCRSRARSRSTAAPLALDEPTTALTGGGGGASLSRPRRSAARRGDADLRFASAAGSVSSVPARRACCATAGSSAHFARDAVDAGRHHPGDGGARDPEACATSSTAAARNARAAAAATRARSTDRRQCFRASR